MGDVSELIEGGAHGEGGVDHPRALPHDLSAAVDRAEGVEVPSHIDSHPQRFRLHGNLLCAKMGRRSRTSTTLSAIRLEADANGRSGMREGLGRGGDSTTATPVGSALAVQPSPGPLPSQTSRGQSIRQPVGRLQASRTYHSRFDACLDYALASHRVPVDYGLSEQGGGADLKLLRLHGSVNWAYCETCITVEPLWIGKLFERSPVFLDIADKQHPLHLEIAGAAAGNAGKCPKCQQPRRAPMMVPPTYSKARHYKQVEKVWRSATRALETAESIIVCGYSLPETDHFFRYLYALGTVGDELLRSFWVFDPAQKEEADKLEERFRKLLGQQGSAGFKYHGNDFENAIRFVAQADSEGALGPRPA